MRMQRAGNLFLLSKAAQHGGSCPANQAVPPLRAMGAASAQGLLCHWVALRKAQNCSPQPAATSLIYRRHSRGSVLLLLSSRTNPSHAGIVHQLRVWGCNSVCLTSPTQAGSLMKYSTDFVQCGFKSVRLQAPFTSDLVTFKVRKFSLTRSFSLPEWRYFILNCMPIN